MNKILERHYMKTTGGRKNVNKEKMLNFIIHQRNAKQSHDDIT